MNRTAVRLDDPLVVRDLACQAERANFVAKRNGLPAIGSTLVNKHGIKWVVQMHAAAPREESLQRWREGDIQPHQDLYPVIEPKNFSPQLMEFFHAIDRCTTKTFAIFDTMPGRRPEGHVPGGNHIDTVCNPATNILYLDAARVPETIIAHELGHAWVQYVDECEDFRTMEDVSDPQRMRQVSFVQSFVLDLKVNDLLRRKGFDMGPIEEDQAVAVRQLGQALARGYQPEHLREEVFMALVVADEIIQRDFGRGNELARFDESLAIIRDTRPPLAGLAETFANSVRKHGCQSRDGILASIDECLIASFAHANDRIDLERELVAVNPEEPNFDKFPLWLPQLSPRTKTAVGKHMARNDISSAWPHELETSITGNARVRFCSPEGDRISCANVNERIGPPNRYSNLPDHVAETLAIRHLREHKRYLTHDGPPHTMQDVNPYSQPQSAQPPAPPTLFPPAERGLPFGHQLATSQPPSPFGPQPQSEPNPFSHGPFPPGVRQPRPYMAGTARFLTAARLQDQLRGEHPYAYAGCNPITRVDPSGNQYHDYSDYQPKNEWVELCVRRLQAGDYGTWGIPIYVLTLGVPLHYWLSTSSKDPFCQSMGYGPGGHWGHRENIGPASLEDLHCYRVKITRQQLDCLCSWGKYLLTTPGSLPGASDTWCDTSCKDKNGDPIHDYNMFSHNCQDFAVYMLMNCHIQPPVLQQDLQ